ncbi:MAG: histidine--tRNA ligase [Endomicrobium sp.]|jgi:histidyl-tRNA synthetase|nr:histidine--tRNA ligase [Endomicrobium sp.]
MKIKYRASRGTHDIFGENILAMNTLETKARNIFKRYGFEEIKTPIFEETALFLHSIGQSTDIVNKELYTFNDKSGRSLSLRPEGTTSIVRYFLENKFDLLKDIKKMFYIGEMFRYERPQLDRYRQFNQIGAEFFGNSSPAADAEIIVLALEILSSIGVKNVNVQINSLGCRICRPAYKNKLLEYLKSIKELCKNCENRLKINPLRILDCKIDKIKMIDIPSIIKYLCNNCKHDFDILMSLLDSMKCKYKVNERLVRGIDYYTKTVFEVYSKKKNKKAILGGGRYNDLIKNIGGKDTSAVGFALGSERVLTLIKDSYEPKPSEKIFIAIADKELLNEAFVFHMKMIKLRLKPTTIFGPFSNKSLTKQLKLANKMKIFKVIIFAKKEYIANKIIFRNMNTNTQKLIPISKII